jgi:hypothetical protein
MSRGILSGKQDSNLTFFGGAGVVGLVRRFSFGAELPGGGTVSFTTLSHG